ncbi:MAG: PhoH family protein [Anaerocolumna sp.]|nr:PhoH family protein [Anaerocolumna sp.]
MTKTYVLDTNVLIQSPYALNSFEDNKIVLPIAVLEELDKLKNDDGERGANARQSIRYLEQLRLTGNLFEGVSLTTGGSLKIEANFVNVELPFTYASDSNDNRILKVCKGLAEKGETIVLVTLLKEQYSGRLHVYASDKAMSEFKKKGISSDQIYLRTDSANLIPEGEDEAALAASFRQEVKPVHNQFFIIHSETSEKKTLLGRYNGKLIVPLRSLKEEPFGVKPANVGQRFLQEALMEEANSAPLVIVKGPAGTAKTFYSLAVGLECIFEADKKSYRRILLTRPNVQFDEDIGFLPGTEQEKIAPYLRPVIDNLEILVDRNEKERYKNEKELRGKIDELFSRGIIMAEAMNFIRGRSITHTYLIIDEAQNLTPKQVKGIVTRVGKGTKVILLGDPGQIDHPLLDERTNGLSYVSEKMKGSPLCYQITMQTEECERSALAMDAAKRM